MYPFGHINYKSFTNPFFCISVICIRNIVMTSLATLNFNMFIKKKPTSKISSWKENEKSRL